MKKITGTPDSGGMSATIGFFIGFAAVSLFGVTAAKIKEVMPVSPLLLGLLISTPALSGSLLRIPFAAWTDTTGGRKPFLVLLVLSIVGMLGLYTLMSRFYPDGLNASFYPLFLFLGVLCGCGIATFSVGIGQVSYWFPQSKQGTVLGLFAGLGNLAPGMFALILPFAIKSLGLPLTYLAWLIFLVVGTVVYWLLGRNAWYFQLLEQGMSSRDAQKEAREKYHQEIFPKGNAKESLQASARNWKTWALLSIYFTTFGGFIALTAWFPTYWSSFYGLAIVEAGMLTALYSILASLMRVVGGQISDGYGGERTLIFSLCLLIVGAAMMFFSNTFALSIIACVLLAIGMGMSNAAVFKLVPQEVPEAVGGAAGWVGGLGAFGGFVIPPVMGYWVSLVGQEGYNKSFGIFLILAVTSLVLTLILKAQHRVKT
ncbi:MAG: NarK/NasA family nitrate transporter [Candidatus Omnitrophica bacterium]|nr:NarK/NasA family nitrate transporter [Candidatus Omnitrophota bacterium]